MDAERWRRAEEIFLDAIELPLEERDAFIASACGDDDGLAGEVRSLIASDAKVDEGAIQAAVKDAATEVPQHPVFRHSGTTETPALDPLIGTRVGAFRLKRLLGKGGMGAVYLAERDDGGFEQLTAIKLIKRGMDSDEVVKRFRKERQILAGLRHQYVARLLDGGSTTDGLPYFVMEYVEGEPIYKYCAKKELNLHDRLRLLSRVCEAVAYAHSRRVVHRDLKPSNILVTADGAPHLLDFGIAKLIDPELADDDEQPTATHMRIMTPEYASPEQVIGGVVRESSDVYALGVMLFELLSGRKPYEFPNRSAIEIARVLGDGEVPRPSDAVRQGTLPACSAGAPGGELTERLRGDLDNIALRALAKDPADRYASVQELLDDIGRYLEGVTVTASTKSAGSPGGRLPRWTWALAAGALFAAGLGWTVANRADSNSGAGQTIAVQPLVNLSGDESSTRFSQGLREELLTELAESGWHIVTANGDVVMEGSVRREGAASRVTVRMVRRKDQSVVWAKAFEGKTERDLARVIGAAARVGRTGPEGDSEATAALVEAYGFLQRDQRQAELNAGARVRVSKAIAKFETAVSKSPNFARGWAGLGNAQWQMADQHDHPQFEEWMRKAEESARRALALDPTLDEAHTVLGAALYFGRHDYKGALESFARGVEFNPRRPTQQRLLADLLCLYGRYDEALAELRRGQELEPLEPDMIVHEALVHYWRRRWQDAERVARRSIAGKPDYWYGHWVLGLVMQQQGRQAEAEQSLERSRAAQSPGLRPIIALGHLWGAAGKRDKAAEAIAEIRAAAKGNLRRYIYPEAMIRASMGEKEQALALLEKSYEIGDLNLPYTVLDPRMDTLRGDPRFITLMRKMGLPAGI